MKAGSIFVLVLTLNFCQARLERTKLVSGSVYALESQHDGAFLTAFGNGKVGGKHANNGIEQGQRWTFTQNGDASWTLAPIIADINLVSEQTWKIFPVSHGKSLLQSLSSNKCLVNTRSEATLIDGSCDKDDPRQRWNIQQSAA
ncbi:uncharacterized protein LOC110862155 [Folsomia candida]|uniref:Uncharacterized protein n=1 Tax=Folsomia candida TaxID=158441 RepID=A0A226CZT9_FOLCA|nr:uncharacterized protein LOC110862155 [Folsomia candida]OXA37997.1 hypothetical protein Fcan01_27221 [Folsomia candida]